MLCDRRSTLCAPHAACRASRCAMTPCPSGVRRLPTIVSGAFFVALSGMLPCFIRIPVVFHSDTECSATTIPLRCNDYPIALQRLSHCTVTAIPLRNIGKMAVRRWSVCQKTKLNRLLFVRILHKSEAVLHKNTKTDASLLYDVLFTDSSPDDALPCMPRKQ